MRYLGSIIVLAAAVLPARADEPKPNTLTPREIADGWLLLFDGETTFGWTIDGDGAVEHGALVLGGARATKGMTTTAFVTELADWEFQARWEGTEAPTLRIPFSLEGTRLLDTAKQEFTVQKARNLKPPVARGSIARPWAFEVPAGSKLFLRTIKIRPLNLKPLFNGKNLTGWKKYEGDKARSKSEFTVTKEGWLHMKSGPGDLQTEGQYDDFVLQLECKTNGKGLNSGVFFRCVPGQYQNGYEAQVHNLYKDNDRRKPADFGTGAIYRRVAARKVVADDHEWFTMTVVAQGKHIATWVNGYQTVDWTDDRPAHENPRQGCRTAKGHISFQGHDPTTDVLFRNIRIVELPKK